MPIRIGSLLLPLMALGLVSCGSLRPSHEAKAAIRSSQNATLICTGHCPLEYTRHFKRAVSSYGLAFRESRNDPDLVFQVQSAVSKGTVDLSQVQKSSVGGIQTTTTIGTYVDTPFVKALSGRVTVSVSGRGEVYTFSFDGRGAASTRSSSQSLISPYGLMWAESEAQAIYSEDGFACSLSRFLTDVFGTPKSSQSGTSQCANR